MAVSLKFTHPGSCPDLADRDPAEEGHCGAQQLQDKLTQRFCTEHAKRNDFQTFFCTTAERVEWKWIIDVAKGCCQTIPGIREMEGGALLQLIRRVQALLQHEGQPDEKIKDPTEQIPFAAESSENAESSDGSENAEDEGSIEESEDSEDAGSAEDAGSTEGSEKAEDAGSAEETEDAEDVGSTEETEDAEGLEREEKTAEDRRTHSLLWCTDGKGKRHVVILPAHRAETLAGGGAYKSATFRGYDALTQKSVIVQVTHNAPKPRYYSDAKRGYQLAQELNHRFQSLAEETRGSQKELVMDCIGCVDVPRSLLARAKRPERGDSGLYGVSTRYPTDMEKLYGRILQNQTLKIWAIKSLAQSVAWLHALGVAHLDLKPGNVAVSGEKNPDKSLQIVLLDLDFSQKIDGEPFAEKWRGTFEYLEPFIIATEDPITNENACAIDMWALGAMFYQILSGENLPPFWAAQGFCEGQERYTVNPGGEGEEAETATLQERYQALDEEKFRDTIKYCFQNPKQQELLLGLFAFDRTQRWTAVELQEHLHKMTEADFHHNFRKSIA